MITPTASTMCGYTDKHT